MASSVARMPFEEWRDPGRLLTAGVHPSFSANNLRKVLVREKPRPSPLPASPSSSSSSSSAVVLNPETNPSASVEPQSPASRRRSQVLDRWAARQAKGMITTIEHRAHEAEISVLSATAQPFSARAASFRRETSPAFSDSSSACSTVTVDVPPNVRASSLIQMWRELEAESGVAPTPRAAANAKPTNPVFPSSAEEPSESSSDGSEDWDSELMASIELAESTVSESRKGRVENIVKMLSSGNSVSSPSCGEDIDLSVRENISSPRFATKRVRGRREIEDLMMRMEGERRAELDKLAERQPVSRFSHRCRIQSLLKFMAMRRESTAQGHRRTSSRTIELNQLQKGSSILSLRERFNRGGLQDFKVDHKVESLSGTFDVQFLDNSHGSSYNSSPDHFATDFKVESSTDFNVQFMDNSHVSSYNSTPDHFATDEVRYDELASPVPELNSPRSRSEDLREGSMDDGSWDERNLWVSNLEWQRPTDSSAFVEAEEIEPYTSQGAMNMGSTWKSESSDPWRPWGVNIRRETYQDLLENFADNVEMTELLERRRVSTSLASDFRDKMNLLIVSFLQRQGRNYFDETITEEDDKFNWQRDDEFNGADQIASGSSKSLVPVPCHAMHHHESWQDASFVQSSSQPMVEMDVVKDLRSDVAQIHHEIFELRRLVESCMDSHVKLQHSVIKPEISAAVYHEPVRVEDSSKWTPIRNGTCCICCEMQVDSLLYRCGHMCTCFKCAHELQWSCGSCPICRAPIVDVVRAYSYS